MFKNTFFAPTQLRLPLRQFYGILVDAYNVCIAVRFAEYTPKEIQDHAREHQAEEASKGRRTLDEAKEIQIQDKKPKAPPRTYDGVVNMVGVRSLLHILRERQQPDDRLPSV